MDLLAIESIKKNYPNFTLQIDDLKIAQNEIVGLIGDNGAGKTTMLEAIKFSPENNTILFKDQLLKNDDPQLGYLKSWGPLYSSIKIRDFIHMYKSTFNEWNQDLCESLLNKYGIDHKSCEANVGDLSTGKLMQLYFVLTICHNPQFLLFDEATSGLDPFIREEINSDLKEFVTDHNIGMIYSSHIISDIEKIATRLLLIRAGKIILDEEIGKLKTDYFVCLKKDLNNCSANSFSIINSFEDRMVIKVMDPFLKEKFKNKQHTIESIVFGLYGGAYA
jgi:ABC-2 type transport system ATP-binding protein